jgi:hypothetical protein
MHERPCALPPVLVSTESLLLLTTASVRAERLTALIPIFLRFQRNGRAET